MSDEKRNFEIIDHNITPEYVTYMLDLWRGDRTDPAVAVHRYIAVFRAEQLENEAGEAFDPNFEDAGTGYYSRGHLKPEPLVWEKVETVKAADEQAQSFSNDYEGLTGERGSRYTYGTMARRKELYVKFLDAIDVLAERPEDQFALKAVDDYRNLAAMAHEK